ncbi:MAG: YggS family pyridoxal phosphate-dependent enzyme [Nitriliruptorales bacterium]|nr:YggS family pyridoxal phosphate-dependent enzyme [Nitriliruptorales bacterium]
MNVAHQLAEVRARMAAACERSGRDAGEVTLVAVSKQQPADLVDEAIAAGLADFGENRSDALRERATRHPEVRWHFVGQLQRRKVKEVAGQAVLVHSLDRAALADAIDRAARDLDVVLDVLVQVDMTGQPRRGGVPIDEAEPLVAYASGLQGTRVTGLMTIPPVDAEPREYFRALRRKRDDLAQRWPDVTELSMGMSQDFEVAIEEGATIVRLGTAIFGHRNTTPTNQDAT